MHNTFNCACTIYAHNNYNYFFNSAGLKNILSHCTILEKKLLDFLLESYDHDSTWFTYKTMWFVKRGGLMTIEGNDLVREIENPFYIQL
jgi:hypothetical protein